MKILAIDSSSMVASVAIAENENLIAEYTVNHKKTHSQTLLPMINEICEMTDTELKTIDAIAITGGPGSFTGLRIGSATAKGLGLALDIPIINVPTMDAMAYNLYGTEGMICPIMDARREQVYTGIYSFKQGEFYVEMKQQPMALVELIDKLNEVGENVSFLGDGIESYRDIICEKMKVPFRFVPLHMRIPKASSLSALAMIYAKENRYETAAEHTPEYLRMSQAERERMERESK